MVNIVMIGLAKELPKHEEKYELHRLLGALLSQDLTANEKLDIIGNEYAIPMEKDFRTISGNPRQFNYRDESAGVCMSAH
ncbi:MAG: hypothetical protein ACLTML_07090 [Blautia faecis]